MLNFKEYLIEAYDFFPKSEEEIKLRLTGQTTDDVLIDIINLFNSLKSKIETPINIDLKSPKFVNVSRALQGTMNISDIKSNAKLSIIKIKFGNGSSGNRGVNNRGNLFEPQFAAALEKWWQGEEVSNGEMLSAIEDLNKTYKLTKSKSLTIDVVGGENTKRPVEYSSSGIIISNTKGSGTDIGSSVTDITLTTDTQKIYLSLKLGTTTTFFNVGIRKVLTPEEIKNKDIKNNNGKALLKTFGIDENIFCDVFNGDLKKGIVDKSAKMDSKMISKLLESGIGHGYHIIHKMSKNILSKKMDKSTMRKAAKVGKGTVFYGGKTGKGKRIDIEFESSAYLFKVNIRDTQGKDGYPTRMMCDFKTK